MAPAQIFEIKNSGTAASPSYSGAPTVLYDFTGAADGANPVAGLTIDANGNLFGTAAIWRRRGLPGRRGLRTCEQRRELFLQTLVAFNGAGATTNSGHDPVANLVMDSAGDLFGTTELGGQNGFGEVFEIKNNGTAKAPNYAGTTTDLYDFTKGSDGAEPAAGLIIDSAGDLFGTTTLGGANGDGTAFELVKGSSGYTLATITSFNDVNNAYSGLVADATGNLFGTLSFGANTPGGSGSVYEIAGAFNAIPTTDRQRDNSEGYGSGGRADDHGRRGGADDNVGSACDALLGGDDCGRQQWRDECRCVDDHSVGRRRAERRGNSDGGRLHADWHGGAAYARRFKRLRSRRLTGLRTRR